MDRVSFCLPRSFRAADWLPSRLLPHADFANYFVHLILRGTAYRRANDDGFVPLQMKILRKIKSWRVAGQVIEALLDVGCVERTANYVPGERSYGYRLSDQFAADEHVRRPATDPDIIARLLQQQGRIAVAEHSRRRPIHHRLEAMLPQLDIDVDLAYRILNELPTKSNRFDCQGILIDDISHKRHRFSVCNFGRVHTALTSLKRELRRALRINDEPIQGTDIRNSQPVFLGVLVQQSNMDQIRNQETRIHYDAMPFTPIEGDFEDYRSFCGRGQIYERLMAAAYPGRAQTKELRDRVKTSFLRDVLARKGNYANSVTSAVAAEFPTVDRAIRDYNRADYKAAICQLQRVESSFVIDDVCTALIKSQPDAPIFTIHDAIYSTPGHVKAVADAFYACAERRNVTLTVDTDLKG